MVWQSIYTTQKQAGFMKHSRWYEALSVCLNIHTVYIYQLKYQEGKKKEASNLGRKKKKKGILTQNLRSLHDVTGYKLAQASSN